jgi:hypothetical protein
MDVCRRRTHQSGPLGELFDHGVDAVNTSLEVLIFAASQNLGMGWYTVMTLFGGMWPFGVLRQLLMCFSSPHILCSNLGRISYEDSYTRHCLWTGGGNCCDVSYVCTYCLCRRRQFLAAAYVADIGCTETPTKCSV